MMYEDSLKTLYGVSCRAVYLLALLGHLRVSVLNGGLEGWIKRGFPTTDQVPLTSKGTFRAKWNPSTWSEVAKAIDDKNAILLDVRDVDEWNGTSSSPYGIDFVPRKEGFLEQFTFSGRTSWKEVKMA